MHFIPKRLDASASQVTKGGCLKKSVTSVTPRSPCYYIVNGPGGFHEGGLAIIRGSQQIQLKTRIPRPATPSSRLEIDWTLEVYLSAIAADPEESGFDGIFK